MRVDIGMLKFCKKIIFIFFSRFFNLGVKNESGYKRVFSFFFVLFLSFYRCLGFVKVGFWFLILIYYFIIIICFLKKLRNIVFRFFRVWEIYIKELENLF